MSGNPIVTERQEAVGIIILNRPEEKNTFNVEFAQQLNAALKDFDRDDDIRVVVIRAAGRHFSTGIALDQFRDKDHRQYRELIRLMDSHNHTIARMKKPVIAMVHGYAVANGAGLVFACDMAVAAESAKFGTTAINVGLICLGPAVPLSRLTSRKKVLEMVLTGDIIPADEALRLGLVNKVVPDEELETATMRLAKKLAAKSPLALQIGKQGIYAMDEMPYHRALDHLSELFASLCSTEDAKEGLEAFSQRRQPQWKEK